MANLLNNRLRNYGLCPSHYLNAPGLSWDAVFKMRKFIFFEKGTKGGIS